jgi:hypothetical protein
MSSGYKGRSCSLGAWHPDLGYKLIEFGVPDKNGLIFKYTGFDYSSVIFVNYAIPKYPWVPAEPVALAKVKVLCDGVYCTLYPWVGGKGDLVRDAVHAGVTMSPMGAGKISESGLVETFVLKNILLNLEHDERCFI